MVSGQLCLVHLFGAFGLYEWASHVVVHQFDPLDGVNIGLKLIKRVTYFIKMHFIIIILSFDLIKIHIMLIVFLFLNKYIFLYA